MDDEELQAQDHLSRYWHHLVKVDEYRQMKEVAEENLTKIMDELYFWAVSFPDINISFGFNTKKDADAYKDAVLQEWQKTHPSNPSLRVECGKRKDIWNGFEHALNFDGSFDCPDPPSDIVYKLHHNKHE